jgi:hypothetical protein
MGKNVFSLIAPWWKKTELGTDGRTDVATANGKTISPHFFGKWGDNESANPSALLVITPTCISWLKRLSKDVHTCISWLKRLSKYVHVGAMTISGNLNFAASLLMVDTVLGNLVDRVPQIIIAFNIFAVCHLITFYYTCMPFYYFLFYQEWNEIGLYYLHRGGGWSSGRLRRNENPNVVCSV